VILHKFTSKDVEPKDVKTDFLAQPVFDWWKPVFNRISDYVMSHVTWLIFEADVMHL